MEGIQFLIDIQERLEGAVAATVALKSVYEGAEKADKGVAHLETTMRHAGASSQHAGGQHEQHGHKIWQLGHQYEYAKNGIHEFAEALGLLLVYEGIEKVIDKLKELVEEMVNVGASAQRTDQSFKALLGEHAGGEVLEEIDGITKHTEFATQKIIDLTAGLLRVGFADEGLRRARAAALDLAALPGGNLEEAASALERIKRTGRVDNRTLGGIGFGENDFLSQMQARTGKGREILKKEMEEGKLDTEQALESLYDLIHRRTGKALGGVGVDMSTTLSARLTHLKDLPEDFMRGLGKSKGLEEFSATIDKILKALDPESETGKKLFASMDKALSSFADVLKSVNIKEFSDGLVALFTALPPLIEASTKALVVFSKLVISTAGAFSPEARKQQMGSSDPTISTLAKIHQWEANNRAYLGKGLRATGAAIMEIATLDHLTDYMGLTGAKAGQGLAKGIESSTPGVEKATTEIAVRADKTARGPKAFDEHSPSRKFMRIGELAAEGLAIGLDRGMDDAIEIPALSASVRPVINGMAPGGARGGVTVTAPVSITVSGSEATPEQIGEAVRIEVASAILSALEQAGLEMGAS